jgi:hypothetical protein
MIEFVLKVTGLKVAYGGLGAARRARPGADAAPPSLSLPCRGGQFATTVPA